MITDKARATGKKVEGVGAMRDKELMIVLLLLLQNPGWVKGSVWECMQTLKLRGLYSSSKLGTVSVVN